MVPSLGSSLDLRRKDLDYDSLRRLVAQWRQVATNYYGDFYPLTPYATSNDVWAAWQFDRPEAGEGMIQAFRRQQSPGELMRFQLQGLDPAARYAVTNVDAAGHAELTGRELMEQGLPISLKKQPDSALILYKRVEPQRQK
jgi:alpha-galactosidase